MRTYDPADRICYVHLAQEPAGDRCDRLPAGYANTFLRPRPAGARPALVLLSGGSDGGSSQAPALRVAR
ncbi:hypothetical protein [Petropleomorpha daqingensis]|uniref:Uncharacterized protein n=1 Tax=Petropleomorpha daqingensis TaxID=2026353 RepID=A0A853CH09_9ACTN|nr:hypothetical protein [Petropleomorpha daqingensis]NYJ07244.1 hypothetical protein [Petropleomorpha daqingensis]